MHILTRGSRADYCTELIAREDQLTIITFDQLTICDGPSAGRTFCAYVISRLTLCRNLR